MQDIYLDVLRAHEYFENWLPRQERIHKWHYYWYLSLGLPEWEFCPIVKSK